MVYVPSARKLGFDLRLNESALREALNDNAVVRVVAGVAADARTEIEAHVRSVASAADADNYTASLISDTGVSDMYGFEFSGPYELGSRPIAVIGIPAGRGANPSAKPPLMVEAQTHSLTSAPGFITGESGEDIR